jgi:ribosomal protein S18 acetylase RimI-like enzyme
LSAPDGIVALDPRNPEHVLAAATLHETLLAHSPIPRLGRLFMTRFFYSLLVEDGLVHGLLYVVDGQYVGFLTFTERPFSFMADAKRAHFLRLVLILGLAVVARPARIRILLDTLAQKREPAEDPAGIGEFLSFGVLEQFATRRDPARGLRIPNVLFDAGIEHFRIRGFRRIEWNVDGSNLRAILFYRAYKAAMEKSPRAWPSDYRVWLDL